MAQRRDSDDSQVRPRPAMLRALGSQQPPSQVDVDGRTYQFVESFKHDSWAASALYVAGGDRIVCKFNRAHPLGVLPLRWLGAMLARREARFMAALADHPQVARLLWPVQVEGRIWPHAVAHTYISGHPLGRREPVADGFFDELAALIDHLHRCNMAYVDLHKRENIIVGDDGRPYLVDFQICYGHPQSWLGRVWPMPQLFAALKRSDLYHLCKHTMRHQSGHLSAHERERAIDAQRPRIHRGIRLVGNRLRAARRRLLVLMKVRTGAGMPSTEIDPEQGVLRDHEANLRKAPTVESPRDTRNPTDLDGEQKGGRS